MAESDEEFVERVSNTTWDSIPLEYRDRLLSLAARGAAVRWRPINEARTGEPCLVALDGLMMPPNVMSKDADGNWKECCADGRTLKATSLASYYIPLTALGEPDGRE